MELNVAYSSDNNYVKYLGISMLSLLINNTENFESINIYIIDNEISKENKEKLIEIAKKFKNSNIIFLDFKTITSKLVTDNKFPISAFGRIFLANVIDKDYLVYLDCDSVIDSSFKELLQIDISNYYAAGVLDNVHYFYKTQIGLKKEDSYINSGFLYINLKKWREDNLQEKMIDFINSFNGSVPHHDQGTINAVCHGKIKILHPKYNLQCPMFNYNSEQIKKLEGIKEYYTDEELQEAKNNPVFIHYTNDFFNRPWNRDCTHPMKNVYIKYMNQSPWKDELEDKKLGRNPTIMKYLHKYLPFTLYSCIYKTVAKRKEKRYKKIWNF